LFITFDNRNIKYIDIHNENITEYVKKWNYEYKFHKTCKYNVYWCKIYLVLEALKTGMYDYVVWLDSDTFIKKLDVDLGQILNAYSSDIFIGSDNMIKHNLINAGVFIIRNSNIGMEFLEDCLKYLRPECFKADGVSLKGMWAASCYEQGAMNLVIADKYLKNTTVLPNNIIFNYFKCSDNTFLMHLYDSTNDQREKCFVKKDN